MLNNKRFIKFKFEKQSDKIKLKDNDINILFYSEKNILLSDNFNSQKNLRSRCTNRVYLYTKHFTILTDAHTHTHLFFIFYPIITCCTANLASSIIFNTDDKRSRFASVSAVSLNSSFTFAGSYKA